MKQRKNYLICPKESFSVQLNRLEFEPDFIANLNQKCVIGIDTDSRSLVFSQEQAKLAFLISFMDDFVMDSDEAIQAKLLDILGAKDEISLELFDSFWSIEEIDLVSDANDVLKFASNETIDYFTNITGYLGDWLKTKPKTD